jgi:hypothetical protein
VLLEGRQIDHLDGWADQQEGLCLSRPRPATTIPSFGTFAEEVASVKQAIPDIHKAKALLESIWLKWEGRLSYVEVQEQKSVDR